MKRVMAVFLACGIVSPQLLAQELPFVFHVSSCSAQTKAARTEVAAKSNLRGILMYGSSASGAEDAELRSIKKQRLISGLLLATSWAVTVVVDLCFEDGYRSTTVVPLAGPWLTLSRMARNNDRGWPGAKALLVVSGVAQTAFATWFIISMSRHPKLKEVKTVSLSAGFNAVNLRIQF